MKKPILLNLFLLLSIAAYNMPISVILANIDETCGNGNGKVWIYSINGGVAPYTYLWSNGSTNDTISNISAGTYSITVTDFTGDTTSKSITVLNNPNLNVFGNGSYVSCSAPGYHPCPFNACDGAIGWCTEYLAGTPPYFISSNIGTAGVSSNGNPYLSGLCNNDVVNVYITDALGCGGADNFTVIGPDMPAPIFLVNGACNNSLNGSVNVTNISTFWSFVVITVVDTQYNAVSNGVWVNTDSVFFDSLAAGNYYLEYSFNASPVTSPCVHYFPFTIPDLGSNCDNVQGYVFVDLNNDCVMDTTDIGVPNVIMEITPGPIYSYTDINGFYSVDLPYGSYTISQIIPTSLNEVCTTAPVNFTLNTSNPGVVIDFADTSAYLLDVMTYMSAGQPRPGFDFSYGAYIFNNNYIPSGTLTVTINYNTILSYVNSNPAPLSVQPGQIVWQLNSIENFQITGVSLTLNVPPNPGLIGDTLIGLINVQAANPDVNLSNNTDTVLRIITGSFDPNEKHVYPDGAILPALNEWIDYTILFQNTGNDTAFNIVIIDTLDADLNVATFIPGASSHPYETELSGQGIVKFIFNNILLPDSIVDEAGSHGFVSFQIKAKSNLSHNTIISNTADIYFDFNPPITTNTVQNNIDLTLAIESLSTAICTGESVTLNIISELLNTTWNWYTDSCTGTLIGSGNLITASPTSTTTYFVSDSAGTIPSYNCFFQTITVNPPVDVSTTVNLNVITANAIGASYQWVDCNNNYLPLAGETNQSFTALTYGNYAVIVTENGCSDTSQCVPVIVSGIVNVNNNDILIYPNPTTGIITIEGKAKVEKEIEVTNVMGNVIFKIKSSELKSEINLSKEAKGIYFVKIIQDGKSDIIKVGYL